MSSYETGDINSKAKGSGARANGGKIALSLVPFHLFAGMTRVLMAGTMKYKAWNWTKGMRWSVCMDCLFRHLFKWWYCGEETDAETGEHHLDHAIANLLFLKHYLKAYPEGDDRPPAETDFALWLDDMKTEFNKDEYLARNPAIAKMMDEKSPDPSNDTNGVANVGLDINMGARPFMGFGPAVSEELQKSLDRVKARVQARAYGAQPDFIEKVCSCGPNMGCTKCPRPENEHCAECPQPEGCKPGECMRAMAVDALMADGAMAADAIIGGAVQWDALNTEDQAAVLSFHVFAQQQREALEAKRRAIIEELNKRYAK